MCKTIIRPVVTYASETRVLTKENERGLNTWERKVTRKIYVPINEGGQWRVRTNAELFGEQDLVAFVKKGRLMAGTYGKDGRQQSYSGRKITERVGNVTVGGEKDGKSKRGALLSTVCLSTYSITENVYYSQLSSVAILLQSETVSHRVIQGNDCVFSPSVLSSFGLPLSTSNGQ
jgi:hypothetical protein